MPSAALGCYMSSKSVENFMDQVGGFLLGVGGALLAVLFGSKSPNAVSPSRVRVPVQPEREAATVLAVDDDATYLNVVSDMLRQGGLNVLSSTSPAKGLDMLQYKGNEIDLVLLDYWMPTLDGEMTLKHMRKVCPGIKVIAVTGVEVEELPTSFRDEVDDFLGKPFKSSDLMGCIQSLLGHGHGGALRPSAA